MKVTGLHSSFSISLHRSVIMLSVLLGLAVSLCGQEKTVAEKTVSEGLLNVEEVHLVTDRDIYIAGEQVFFTVTQSGRLTHVPGTISKVVYVDLLDSYKTPVVQVRTGTDGFIGAGVFRIPDTLRTGNYFIRSFTNLMKNFPQSFFAYRMITVINPFRSLAGIRIPPSDHQADSVVFFPESGSLVAGLETRLGIKCFNSNGDPVVTRGIVITASGDTVAIFSTDRHGTGLFSLNPPDAGQLSLVAFDKTGAERRFELPAVEYAGLTIHLLPQSCTGEVSLRLSANNGFRGRPVKVIYTPVCYAPVVREVYAEGSQDVTFESGSLPEGLAKISVTDGQGRELASRWFYNNSNLTAELDVSISSPAFNTREKAGITLKMTDGEGHPLSGVLSVSVVKQVLVNETCFDGHARNVLLPSVQSFRTEMIQPGINDFLIFCEQDGDTGAGSGDIEDIIHLPEQEGHLVSGIIRATDTDEPLAGEALTLSVVGRAARCSFTRSDNAGRFSFPVREYGRKEIVIQRLKPGGRAYYIDLDDPFLFEMRLNQVPGPFYPDTTRLNELNDAVISMQVSNIYNPFTSKKSVRLYNETFPGFFSEVDRTVILSEFIQLTTLREVFKEIVPGLTTSGRNENLALSLTHRYQGLTFDAPPMVILDGIPVYDLEKLLDIPSSKIERVEVLNTRYFLGDFILDGIINIISHKGDLSVLDFDRAILRQEYDMMLDGYDILAPDYSSDSLKAGRIPDYRNTLYWNPVVRTDDEGIAELEFWTSDEAGNYFVITDYISYDGRRGSKVTPLIVVKN